MALLVSLSLLCCEPTNIPFSLCEGSSSTVVQKVKKIHIFLKAPLEKNGGWTVVLVSSIGDYFARRSYIILVYIFQSDTNRISSTTAVAPLLSLWANKYSTFPSLRLPAPYTCLPWQTLSFTLLFVSVPRPRHPSLLVETHGGTFLRLKVLNVARTTVQNMSLTIRCTREERVNVVHWHCIATALSFISKRSSQATCCLCRTKVRIHP